MKFYSCALWLGFSLGAQVAGEQSVVVVDSLMRPGAHATTIEQGIAMVASRGTVFVRVPAFSGYTLATSGH